MPFFSLAGNLASTFLGNEIGARSSGRGARRDFRFYRERDQYDWQKAEERGLTAQEFYGSPAAGGSPDSANTQTLGNNVSQMYQQAIQLGENEKNRQNAENIARISADATRYSADTAREGVKDTAVTNLAITRLNNIVKNREIDLKEREFNEVTLKAAAANLELTEKEIQIATHKVTTESPDFVRQKILLQMGFDNTLQNYILKKYNVDPTSSKSVQSLSDKKYQEILELMLGYNSSIGRELRGTARTATDLVKYLMDFAGDAIKHLPKGQTIGSGPPAR